MEDIIVKMGDLAAAHNDAVIKTFGIGSCAVIVLYDAENKVGGLCHAMLPGKAEDSKHGTKNPLRYTDTAIDALIQKLQQIGGDISTMKAKLIGGAQMFSLYAGTADGPVGDRNIKSAKQKLREVGIPITNQDVGGSTGRSVIFDTVTGRCAIQTKM